MSEPRCPSRELLLAYHDLALAPAEERAIGAHLGGCAGCRGRRVEIDPALLFTEIERRTLAEPAWDQVMAAVLAEARREAPGLLARLLVPLGVPRLAAVGALGTAVLLVVLSALLVTGQPPARVEPWALAADKPGVSRGFVYLSNPQAQVTHVVLGARPGGEPVQFTMIIDESLDEGLDEIF